MKVEFRIDNVASSAEIDNARKIAGPTAKMAIIVTWISMVMILLLVYPFGRWFAGQLPLLDADSIAATATITVIQYGFIILGTCATFIAVGLYLVSLPFKDAINYNIALQPLKDFESSNLVRVFEAYPELEKYRCSVVAVREFVYGDYELIMVMEAQAARIAKDAGQERKRQEVFDKLHRVE